jgi:hypothetical protein
MLAHLLRAGVEPEGSGGAISILLIQFERLAAALSTHFVG